MEELKHFPEKSILRKPFRLNREQPPSSSSSTSMRKHTQKPVFEGRIKAAIILDESDPSLSPTEVFEALHEDESDKKTPIDSQSRRKSWLRQAISVDGERVPGKLLHQCSLEHGYIRHISTSNEEAVQQNNQQDNTGDDNDLEDLQSQRALVEAELRRKAKAPPGLKIRDLLASRSIIEDEDDEENERGGGTISNSREDTPVASEETKETSDQNNAQARDL
ncbi:unnamed protein product [Rodentolepis nana]|uniref:DUF4604 domain-containing protein n=1 Tax=Rodentolepis nana TaxID=102285 RepID=A0A0R3T3Y4_RODNA|nr:unnamed protein product [Rodentolepis nana]